MTHSQSTTDVIHPKALLELNAAINRGGRAGPEDVSAGRGRKVAAVVKAVAATAVAAAAAATMATHPG